MNILGRVRFFMEKNKYLQKWVDPLRGTKIMTYWTENIRDLPKTKGERAIFKAVYEEHKEEFEKVFQMLEDDFSRKTLQTVIDYRLDPQGGGY